MPPKFYMNQAASEVTVACEVPAAKRKVTYIFNTTTKKNLSIPYAVAVDDVVLTDYKDKPKRIPRTSKTITQEKIEVEVDSGAKVALHLNSDAHPSYRKNPVYQVTADKHDIEVTITEKKGKHSDADTPALSASDEKKKLDTYTAPLTGDIWMKITHKYTAEDVDSLLPAGTGDEVKAAVKSIYEGLTQKKVTITLAATATKPETKIEVNFSDSDNPKDNIVTYDLLTDGLPRVHPGGYAATFNAAIEAGVPSLSMSSAWRPLLGSIAHRAGLGLDVSYVGTTRMNRQELHNADAIDTDNVSDEEEKLFKEFETAKTEEETAKKAADTAKKAYENAKKTEEKALKLVNKAEGVYENVKNNAVKGPAAQEAVTKARKACEEPTKNREEAEKAWKKAEEPRKKATEKREKAEKAWNDERDENEPEGVRKFRNALAASPSVAQLFDPWFMDENTQDKVAATPNVQKSDNETLHAHHLHVTVKELKILS